MIKYGEQGQTGDYLKGTCWESSKGQYLTEHCVLSTGLGLVGVGDKEVQGSVHALSSLRVVRGRREAHLQSVSMCTLCGRDRP